MNTFKLSGRTFNIRIKDNGRKDIKASQWGPIVYCTNEENLTTWFSKKTLMRLLGYEKTMKIFNQD